MKNVIIILYSLIGMSLAIKCYYYDRKYDGQPDDGTEIKSVVCPDEPEDPDDYVCEVSKVGKTYVFVKKMTISKL